MSYYINCPSCGTDCLDADTLKCDCGYGKELTALRQPPADVAPRAWLITSKHGLVRCAITTAPTQDHIECAEWDGDTITPLYAHPPVSPPADVGERNQGCKCGYPDMPGSCPGPANCPMCQEDDWPEPLGNESALLVGGV